MKGGLLFLGCRVYCAVLSLQASGTRESGRHGCGAVSSGAKQGLSCVEGAECFPALLHCVFWHVSVCLRDGSGGVQVQSGGPGEKAGLEAFFDFIVEADGVELVCARLHALLVSCCNVCWCVLTTR